ncbi:hypothetical protein CC86DRAFT_369598 [Ophiobolus disseminans]|uniref:Uncharacterized protein n=1 Tax=Ophiobolus disseminans TaxID=1469910 RepID=A0A6A7A402_9PLEO|nr:hypothetical protein CC86DRAFT_369598 [Ophiobolus disseminans]
MATAAPDSSQQFQEPLSPTTSTEAPKSSPTQKNSSAKPSIVGVLKNAVTAPSAEERETSPIEAAIESVGEDGEKRGS